MAVCNIFNPLQKKTGTFLTFSQYSEDLSQEQSFGSNYHIVPSKYIAIYGDYQKFSNRSLPKKLQEQFENACSMFRAKEGYNPSISKGLFWDFMFDNDIIKSKQEDKELFVDGIQYAGDINLHSYDKYNDMGYSEIYCYIPNNESLKKYQCVLSKNDKYDSIQISRGGILTGYQENELNGWEEIGDDYIYKVNDYTFAWEDNSNLQVKTLDDEKFEINTIVILYNIYDSDNILYSDIPMGIYFTGLIDDTGNMSNIITKFVSNDDIYNSGTSYGLRICSRFSVSPQNDNLLVQNVSLEDNNYSDLSRVLAELSKTQNQMSQIIDKKYQHTQDLKDTLSIFMNSRINVPYIKNINGQDYWFVNGRLISQIDDQCCDYDSFTESEMNDILNPNLKLTFTNLDNLQLLRNKKDFSNPDNVKLKWATTYKGKMIVPDNLVLYVNNVEYQYQPDETSNEYEVIFTEPEEYKIELKANYKGLEASQSISIKYIYPSYFGYLACNNNEIDHDFTPSLDQILSLDKYLLTSKNAMFDVNTTELKHVVYIYPENFGDLEKIIGNGGYIYYDSSQSDEFNDFNKVNDISIDNVNYIGYIDKAPVIIENQKLKFK